MFWSPLLHWGKHCSCVHACVRLVLQSEEGGPLSGPEPTSLAMAHEQDGYVMVDLTDIVRPLSWMFCYVPIQVCHDIQDD